MKHATFTTIRSARRLSEIEFCAWIGAAAPGEMIQYHRGFLAVDIIAVISKLPEPKRAALKKLAARAYWAAEERLVHLVQRRNGPDDFSYLAIARPRRNGAIPDFATLMITEEAA
jgi:hypothetical protein